MAETTRVPRASFTMNLGAENHNLNIYAFARWIDTTNPARANSEEVGFELATFRHARNAAVAAFLA